MLTDSPLDFPVAKDFDPSPDYDPPHNNFNEAIINSDSDSLPRDDENLSDDQISFGNHDHPDGDLYQIQEEDEEDDSFEKDYRTKR